VIGVMPSGFDLMDKRVELWLPLQLAPAIRQFRASHFLSVLGRLKDGVTSQHAEVELASLMSSWGARARVSGHLFARGEHVLQMTPVLDAVVGSSRRAFWVLQAAVALVLLIACANVAGLLLTRAAARSREIAVRLAVGASRWQVTRQLLIENLLVSAAGCGAGLLFARWASGALAAFVPPTPYPVAFDAALNARSVSFAMALAIGSAVVSGVLPALRASRPEVGATLKSAAPTGTGRQGRLRQLLVVGQVGLCVVLLVCASLFARSLSRAASADTGFTLRTGLLASIDLLPAGYDEARGGAFFQALRARVAALPHVTGVAVARSVPLDLSGGSDTLVTVDGYSAKEGEDVPTYYNQVGPGYFDTMGIPMVRGRAIDDHDAAGQPRVAVINETMARRYWPNRDAVGGVIRFGSGPVTVVGVARDGKYQRLSEAPRNYLYLPVLQNYRPDLVLHVRTDGDPALVASSVQAAVRALDPNLPLFDVRTVEDHMRISTFIPRLAASMLGLFGVLGLLLASVGLYGVIAFNASERTREIGLRMALGAGRAQVVWLVLREGFALAAAGIAGGIALAFVAGRLVAGQLTGISGADPLSFASTAALLAAVAALACILPARRASALNPLTALRRD
jgi:macrolide transport system ATP-binding/permease protein